MCSKLNPGTLLGLYLYSSDQRTRQYSDYRTRSVLEGTVQSTGECRCGLQELYDLLLRSRDKVARCRDSLEQCADACNRGDRRVIYSHGLAEALK